MVAHAFPAVSTVPLRAGSLNRVLVDAMSGAAALVSGLGVVVEANEDFSRLAGFGRDELVGRAIPLRDGVPDGRGGDPRDVRSLPTFMASVVVMCADGAQASVLASITRIDDAALGGGFLVRVPLQTVPKDRLRKDQKHPRVVRTKANRGAHQPVDAKAVVTSELELAAQRGEFFSRYQPIVSLSSGWIDAFEALLRWDHPTHGVVGPAAFLGEAEARGILTEITCQILHDACQDAAHWNTLRTSGRPISVSVNLCGSQLRDVRLIDSIEDALSTSGLPASQLWLEITENTGITEATRDPGQLRGIRKVGVRLVLDDFGAGYASLGSVRRLPLDALKFDRSLVAGAADNRCDARILAAGIEIAEALEIDVIAEGIEHERQLGFLQSLGCPYGQGYYYSRPLDHQRAEMLVSDPPTWLAPANASALHVLTALDSAASPRG
jgi:EAL domain-containing protein (putative c-di-GMP-specific phosphodiesterase class I)